MLTTHTTSRPGGKAPTPVVEQQDVRATSCDRPVSITTTRTKYFADHKVLIDGVLIGQVAESLGVPADQHPFAAVGQAIMLGWHRTRDQAVDTILAVHEAIQAERRTR